MTRSRLLAIFLTVFSVQYLWYLVHWVHWDRMIKITAFLGMFFFARFQKIPRGRVNILALYAALFLTTLVFPVLERQFVGFLQTFKILFAASPLFFLLSHGREGERPRDELLNFPFPVALFCSIQGILLFTFIYWGVELRERFILLETKDFMLERSFGVLGYANVLRAVGPFSQIVRIQSWFLEPANLAGFLIPPLFLSLGRFMETRKTGWLFSMLLILVAFVLTASLAGFFGMIAAGLFWRFYRPGQVRGKPLQGVWSRVKPFLLLAVFLFSARGVLQMMYWIGDSGEIQETRMTRVLGRDRENQTMVRGASRLSETVLWIRNRPFGLGFGGTLGVNVQNSSNALIYWTIAGGIPALLLWIAIWWKLFYSYALPIFRSRHPVGCALVCGWLGLSVQHLSYGNWIDPYYCSIVAMVVLWGEFERGRERSFPKRVQHA